MHFRKVKIVSALMAVILLSFPVYGEYVCRVVPNSPIMREEDYMGLRTAIEDMREKKSTEEEINKMVFKELKGKLITTDYPMRIMHFTHFSDDFIGIMIEERLDSEIYIIGINHVNCIEEE